MPDRSMPIPAWMVDDVLDDVRRWARVEYPDLQEWEIDRALVPVRAALDQKRLVFTCTAGGR